MSTNLRQAVRAMARQPVFTGTIVLILSLGIGANTAMFATLRAALAVPDAFPEPERLVFAACTFNGQPNPMASAPDFYDYREQADQFESLTAMASFGAKTTLTGGEPERVPVAVVSHEFFRTLRVEPVAGRSFAPVEGGPGGERVLVISERLAARRFGAAASAPGQSLVADGHAATVIGVIPASFRFLGDVDVWVPMRRDEGIGSQPRQFHNWVIFGRLKPGATIESAQAQVDGISRALQLQYPGSNRNKALALFPLRMAFVGRQLPRLAVLGAAVVLLLLIACANVAGMLMARGSARRGELAVRASLGATRRSLVAQLMTESLVLALVSGVAGALLAAWLQRLLPLATGLTGIERSAAGVSWAMLGFALALSVATALLFGVAPAIRSSALDPARDLSPGARATERPGSARLRAVLVTGQVALSLVLLVAAGLVTKSLARLASADPGFVVDHVLTGEIQLLPPEFATPASRSAFFDALREDLAAIPGVTAVGFTSHVPLRHRYSNWPVWPSDRPPASPADRRLAHARAVLPGYFAAMRIPLIAGRDFSASDREDSPKVMVINERMARTFFPGQNPIGQRVQVDRGREAVEYEIVGIAGNARLDTMSQEPPMAMYAAYAQFPQQQTMRFAIRTALPPDTLIETVRRLVKARSRDVPVENLVSMERLLADSMESDRVTATTLGAFSAVALLLAAIGLYGVLAFSVAQRTHEIGVRMALGAGTRAVVGRVLARTAIMVGPGLALGLTGAMLGSRLIGSLLFEVTPTDPATILMMTGALAAVAVAASALPAWRAAHIDPVRALRGE